MIRYAGEEYYVEKAKKYSHRDQITHRKKHRIAVPAMPCMR